MTRDEQIEALARRMMDATPNDNSGAFTICATIAIDLAEATREKGALVCDSYGRDELAADIRAMPLPIADGDKS